MIYERFAVEYAERCLTLLKEIEPIAEAKGLLVSFTLLAATAVFVIPYERMRARHPLYREGEDDDLNRALRNLKKQQFYSAKFWNGEEHGEWRFSRIMQCPNDTDHWIDECNVHPMAMGAANSIMTRSVSEVFEVVRNALAHGNVVYLNGDGREERGTEVQYLGFLSRYEDSDDKKKVAETYRLVVTTDKDFLRFVRAWATWVSSFPPDKSLSEVI